MTKQQDNNESAASLRKSRYRKSVLSLSSSKVSALAIHLIAIPMAWKYCGIDTYGVFLVMAALSSGVTIPVLRMGPSYISKTANLLQNSFKTEMTQHFSHGLTIVTISCAPALFLALVIYALLQFGVFRPDIFRDYIYTEITLLIFLFMSILTAIIGFLEGYQSGMQDTHLQGIRSTIANILSAILVVVFIPIFSNVLTLVLCLHVLPFTLRLANVILYFNRKKSLFDADIKYFDAKLLNRNTLKSDLFTNAAGFTFCAGLFAQLGFQLPMILLSDAGSPVEGGFYATTIYILIQVSVLVSILSISATPAIGDALAVKDFKNVRLIIFGTMGCIIIGVVIGLLMVPYLVSNFQEYIPIPPDIAKYVGFTLAILAGLIATENFLFGIILAAFPNTNKFRLYQLIGIRSVLCACAAYVLVQQEIPSYYFLVCCFTYFLFTVVPFILLTKKQMMTEL